MDVFCFGDSITYGESDTERGGWVDRLKAECMSGFLTRGEPEVNVFNLGLSGETTAMMRARLSTEVQARLDPRARSVLMLAYGANDAAESGGARLVPLEQYVEHLAWAIDEGRRLRCEVWLVNVTPVAPGAEGVPSRRSGRLRSNAVVSQYNEALDRLSQRTSAALVDVNGAFRRHELTSLFAADGVHPNADGHALLCRLVRERVLPAASAA